MQMELKGWLVLSRTCLSSSGLWETLLRVATVWCAGIHRLRELCGSGAQRCLQLGYR